MSQTHFSPFFKRQKIFRRFSSLIIFKNSTVCDKLAIDFLPIKHFGFINLFNKFIYQSINNINAH